MCVWLLEKESTQKNFNLINNNKKVDTFLDACWSCPKIISFKFKWLRNDMFLMTDKHCHLTCIPVWFSFPVSLFFRRSVACPLACLFFMKLLIFRCKSFNCPRLSSRDSRDSAQENKNSLRSSFLLLGSRQSGITRGQEEASRPENSA